MILVLAVVMILSWLILFYNVGYLLLAKLFHYEIEEFGFGYPPRLIAFTIGRTCFALNLIPLGGYVRVKNLPLSAKGTLFMCAGPLALLLVFFTFTCVHQTVGVNVPTGEGAIVLESSPDKSNSSLLPGDLIINAEGQQIHDGIDLAEQIRTWNNAGKLTLVVIRNEYPQQITIVCTDGGEDDNPQKLGLVFSSAVATRRYDPLTALVSTPEASAKSVIGAVAVATAALKLDSSGNVGLSFWKLKEDFGLLRLAAFLAFFISIVNLIPFPSIIGGQVLVAAIKIALQDIQIKHIRTLAVLLALVFFWIPLITLAVLALTGYWPGPNLIDQIIRWAEVTPKWMA